MLPWLPSGTYRSRNLGSLAVSRVCYSQNEKKVKNFFQLEVNVWLFTQIPEKTALMIGQNGLHQNGLVMWLVRGRKAERNKVGLEFKFPTVRNEPNFVDQSFLLFVKTVCHHEFNHHELCASQSTTTTHKWLISNEINMQNLCYNLKKCSKTWSKWNAFIFFVIIKQLVLIIFL